MSKTNPSPNRLVFGRTGPPKMCKLKIPLLKRPTQDARPATVLVVDYAFCRSRLHYECVVTTWCGELLAEVDRYHFYKFTPQE